jgi:hypothetical protein
MATNPPANARRRADFACVRRAEDRRNFPASVGFAVPWSGVMLSFPSLVVSHAVWTASFHVTSDGFSWPPA